MTKLTVEQTFDLAMQHHQAGRLPQAEQLYQQVLAAQPRHAPAMQLLGLIAHQRGSHDMAVDLMRRSIAVDPNMPEAHSNLGMVLKYQGKLDEAVTAYRRAIAIAPELAEIHNNLGNALRELGKFDEAIAAFGQAIKLKPNYASAHNNLGVALAAKGQLDQAVAAYRRAMALNPKLADAHNNLGNALELMGQLDEGLAECRQAIVLKPDYAEAYNNLANILKDCRQLEEAMAAYRQAVAIRPSYVGVHSNLILAMQYYDGWEPQSIGPELSRWSRQHAEPFAKLIQPHSNDSDPDRRLRIGYVSADFYRHASANFLIPLLEHHDPKQVELFCYAQVFGPDELTGRFQKRADHWRNIVGLSDDQAAEQIRQDRIDILVDLKLHTADNRLLIFARKPAPVQASWLGGTGSTGLHTIDYRLSDPYLDPADRDESIYTEQTIRLPESFWCYDPLDGRQIPVTPLPALQNGRITFGCLNNFCKISDSMLALWAQILEQVPGSRLLMLAHQGMHRQRVVDRLHQAGIAPERIEFASRRPRSEYLQLFNRIDISLDSFPCNGHTTSLDSFWMGVPLVTLVGKTAVCRAGWCQLSNLKLTDLAAYDGKQYVRIAVALAGDLPRLGELRATLRVRMEQSPLMDARRFAGNVEAAYRQMWQAWCASAGGKGR